MVRYCVRDVNWVVLSSKAQIFAMVAATFFNLLRTDLWIPDTRERYLVSHGNDGVILPE
jgi:hypothetical protein